MKNKTELKACAQTFRVMNSGDCTQDVEVFFSDEGCVALDLHRFDSNMGSLEVKNAGQMRDLLKAILQFLEGRK